ncbi:MAG TPA: transglycosylase SLT domain-containing protein [Bryobacteraceae bacterium]|nr:transglycosylase SLT domain-containing protein [Bryobacteraceae bacterium]
MQIVLPVLLTASGIAAHAPKKPPRTVKPAKKKAPAKPSPKAVGAAGLIAIAQHQLDLGNFELAAATANSAAAKAPILNDYAQYIRAQAEYKRNNYAEVAKAATQVFNQQPLSPMIGSAAALAVSADLNSDNPKRAFDLIKKYFDRIPQPQGTFLLARAFKATGDLTQAAEYHQRVYYNYPLSTEATDSANALVDLKQRLGETYPAIMPGAMLGRAQKLLDAKKPAEASVELAAAIPQLAGAQRDLARVRLGEADFFSGKTQDAFAYLTALKVDDPEADAERLSYLIRAARKLNRDADVRPFLTLLEQHPTSPWRLDALIYVADQARSQNDAATYLPLYRACATSFGADPKAEWCHWQVTFNSYRKQEADAFDLLRAYLQHFPDSNNTSDALYFLGRLMESKNDMESARACYDEMAIHFSNTYFATLANERLAATPIKAANPSSSMLTFLQEVPWQDRGHFPSFEPGPVTQKRLSRAQLLRITGLDDMAENELKFGARNDSEPRNVYALQLAKMATQRNSPEQAVRYIKSFAPGYTYLPLDEAPPAFWQMAFPIPFRRAIDQYSREQGLDPFLVAALIRQESEFDVKVISRSNAYGLMQLLPSTGRQLARHFGIRRLNSTDLLTPDRNIQLGTYFFRNLLNSYGGQPEIALASYNAGPGRANLWRTWGPFREPAEFIETVPFHETRGYIQFVLRNADVYRRLYAGKFPDLPPYHPKPAPTRKSLRKNTPNKGSL